MRYKLTAYILYENLNALSEKKRKKKIGTKLSLGQFTNNTLANVYF